MAPIVRRVTALLALIFSAAVVFAAPAIADSTEDFPIPRRIIATPCDAEQYLAAARDTSPVYFDRYMRDKSNRPADVQQSAVDRIWAKIFFNSKGVVAKATEVCNNYPRGDMSVWDWPGG